jgi:glutaminase
MPRLRNEHVRSALQQSTAFRMAFGNVDVGSQLGVVSGASGIVLLHVPNVGGVAVYSPLVDASNGVSVRACEFIRRVQQHYNL